jgi:hypothetical protein
MEISMELHMVVGSPNHPQTDVETAVAFYHLAYLGYAVYSQEINEIHPECCCEFSFRRLV